MDYFKFPIKNIEIIQVLLSLFEILYNNLNYVNKILNILNVFLRIMEYKPSPASFAVLRDGVVHEVIR